jgi:hypothetical protein
MVNLGAASAPAEALVILTNDVLGRTGQYLWRRQFDHVERRAVSVAEFSDAAGGRALAANQWRRLASVR